MTRGKESRVGLLPNISIYRVFFMTLKVTLVEVRLVVRGTVTRSEKPYRTGLCLKFISSWCGDKG